MNSICMLRAVATVGREAVAEIRAFIWGGPDLHLKHLVLCLILKKLNIWMKIGDFWPDPLGIFADHAILK